jgi:predicted ferric reductase
MAAIGLLCIFVGSRDYIRRNYFEVFYISHVFGILLFIGAGLTHQYAVIVFLVPSIFLYFSDRIIRALRTWKSPTRIIDVTTPHQQDITQIVFKKDGRYAKTPPGQFVFVSLNDGTRLSRFVNFFNWHPFTLSEIYVRDVKEEQSITHDNDKEIATTTGHRNSDIDFEIGQRTYAVKKAYGPLQASVHIKSLGNMTHRLHRQAINEPQHLKMKIDGPYGSAATTLEMNQVVAFFEAGIGITPSLTMFRDLVDKCAQDPLKVHTTHIYFIWATASMGEETKVEHVFFSSPH